jgi:hypothetical protein
LYVFHLGIPRFEARLPSGDKLEWPLKQERTLWREEDKVTSFANELISSQPFTAESLSSLSEEQLLNYGKQLVLSSSVQNSPSGICNMLTKAVDQELEVYPLTEGLFSDAATCPWLVIRPETKALWAQVDTILSGTMKQHVAVIGTPGIGKSRGLTYELRRCLQEGRLVYYQETKMDMVYAFVPVAAPKGNGIIYRGFSVPLKDLSPYALASSATYFLIDAGEADRWTVRSGETKAVMACSTDRMHFSEWTKDSGTELYMAGWDQDGLVAAAPFMTPKQQTTTPGLPLDWLEEDQIRVRADKVGPIPRSVLHFEKHQSTKSTIISTAASLSENPRVLQALLSGSFEEVFGKDTNEKVNSRLFGFRYSPDADLSLASTFKSPNIAFHSPGCRDELISKAFSTLVNRIEYRDSKQACELGDTFERLYGLILSDLVTKLRDFGKPLTAYLTYFPEESLSAETAENLTKKQRRKKIKKQRPPTFIVDLEPCELVMVGRSPPPKRKDQSQKELTEQNDQAFKDLVEAASKLPRVKTPGDASPNRLLLQPRQGYPALDYVDAPNRVYQVTIGKEHKIETTHLLKFAKAMGWTEKHPGHFFTAVPPNLFPATGGYLYGQLLKDGKPGEKAELEKIMLQYVVSFMPEAITKQAKE